MKITFDTTDHLGDPDTLGEIVSTFLLTQTTHCLSEGFRPTVPGWTKRSNTLAIADALSADDPALVHHFEHDATGMEVAWVSEGYVTILVRRAREETSTKVIDRGFAIINHHGGRSGDWANY